MSRIPEFEQTLQTMLKIHESKNIDYANESNPFSNFDLSEQGLKLFPNPRDGAFAWPIFTKLARLSVLMNGKDKPNNESVQDSLIDIANYTILWKCDISRRYETNQVQGYAEESIISRKIKTQSHETLESIGNSLYRLTFDDLKQLNKIFGEVIYAVGSMKANANQDSQSESRESKTQDPMKLG